MSLVRIAARIAAVQALKGQTLVGDNVLDSKIGAIDVGDNGALDIDEEKPFISVYTDGGAVKDVTSRSFYGPSSVDFLIEFGVTASHVVTNQETLEDVLVTGLPSTDDNMELQLDLLARQIGDALSNSKNDWAEIFKQLVSSFKSIARTRADTDKGVRAAAQQIKIEAELVSEPSEWPMPNHALSKFLTKATADEDDIEMQTRCAKILAALTKSELSYEKSMRRFGLTKPDADALLLTPAVEGAGDASFSQVEVETEIEPVAG